MRGVHRVGRAVAIDVAIAAARQKARRADLAKRAYWQKHRGVLLPWFGLVRRWSEAEGEWAELLRRRARVGYKRDGSGAVMAVLKGAWEE